MGKSVGKFFGKSAKFAKGAQFKSQKLRKSRKSAFLATSADLGVSIPAATHSMRCLNNNQNLGKTT